MNWLIIVVVFIILMGLSLPYIKAQRPIQSGGEYMSYIYLSPDNSRRLAPLGYLSDQGYSAPSLVSAQCHATPSRVHPRGVVYSDGRDERKNGQGCGDHVYADQFDFKPYDWKPFDYRPFWLRRAHLEPSARNCQEYSTDQCIGTGASDYQSCYDEQRTKCPFPKELNMLPEGISLP